MEFLARLVPVAISTAFSIRTAELLVHPTSAISFFGLFWLPYHHDLPYRIMRDAFVVGMINAVLSLIAPRYPRLLSPYLASASPKLPFDSQKLLPDSPWWTIAFFTIGIIAWVGDSMGMGLSYRFVLGLALYTLAAACGVFVVVQAVVLLWGTVRGEIDEPPLGLVTGMLWPPLHPLQQFLIRTGNRISRSLRRSEPRVEDLKNQKESLG